MLLGRDHTMKRFRRVRFRILAASGLWALVIGVGSVAGVWAAVLKERRLEAAYVAIQIGDPRDRLVALAGPADATGDCSDPHRPYRSAGCHEDLRYGSMYQSWYYSFDGEGKLTQKVECFLGEYCNKVGR